LETVRPSPFAVTVKDVVATGEVRAAATDNVAVEVAVPGVGVKVALLHEGVTVAGSPVIVRVTGPLKEPPVEKVNRSLALAPCTTGSVVIAGEKVNVGALNFTVNGIPPVAEYGMPVLASVICVEKLRVPLLATALTVPVRVRVQLTVFDPTVGLLHVAMMPVGSPEVIATVAPAPPAGTVTPPIPVAVSVTELVDIEYMDREECESDIVTPGACNTWTV
jgi:hypothetical protein